MKLKDIFGLTSYLAYGGGNAHYKTDAVDKFKFQRFFVGNYVITKGNLDLRVEPTWQNFKYDTYLKQLKDLGVTTVFSPQGSFDWYNTQGKIGKVNPIKPGDDPLLESSWADFKELCRQLAIRYADDTAQYLSEAKVFTGLPAYLANVPKAGLGLVDYLTGTNEYTFLHGWSGAAYTLTPEMGAVQMKVIIDGVRSVSKTLKIVCPSDHTPNLNNQRRLLTHLKSLYAAEGKPMPTDFYLDFHWYMRNTSQDQSGGTAGETPETINAYAHAQAMDALCDEYGLLGWLCTETGWATDNSKQSAPILEGFTREQSQGILMIRLALIWGASKYCKGISFWHCRDDYDLPPYAKGGINKKDWSAKPARTICEEFLAEWGEYEVSNYRNIGKGYYVDTVKDGLKRTLSWTNKEDLPEFDAMPDITAEIPMQEPITSKTFSQKKLLINGEYQLQLS